MSARRILLVSPRAARDLDAIADYAARDNPARALMFVAELEAKCRAVAQEPAHFPAREDLAPGPRKHRLFSFITMNWRGKPLVSYAVIIALIGATTTDAGLTVRCEHDEAIYQKGTKVWDAEMEAINITRAEFHGERNYTIRRND